MKGPKQDFLKKRGWQDFLHSQTSRAVQKQWIVAPEQFYIQRIIYLVSRDFDLLKVWSMITIFPDLCLLCKVDYFYTKGTSFGSFICRFWIWSTFGSISRTEKNLLSNNHIIRQFIIKIIASPFANQSRISVFCRNWFVDLRKINKS